MTQHPLRRTALAALALTAFTAAPAHAQDQAPAQGEQEAADDGAFDITATATVVSDYRFRGVSLSDRDPALQGSVDITWRGFYAGAWASSISRFADTNVELDLYAGYAGAAGPVEYEIGAIAYLYPGGDGTGNVYEATGALSYRLGPVQAKLSAFYAPDQENLAGDNLYLSAEAKAGIPGTPFTLFGQFGRERGSFYGRKHDWSFGAEYTRGPFTASLGYFDTDLNGVTSGLGRNVRSGIVASASFEF
ncbi:MAG: hypothetical protein QOD42_2020 [Sphingomonadales bacterium]|jgi:uncharacterized protein (TIGR02001 family)|nr:hypothetical protein [Sphingomonadales bacterium]